MDESTKTIPLTQGHVAIVDADDYEDLNKYKWHVKKNGNTCYAETTRNKKTIKMHRQILNAPDDLCCDHKNHNGLDNRKANLRLCTVAQNNYNKRPLPDKTSKYKGVFWCYENKKWRAEIRQNNSRIHIGYFDYEQDAAIAYDDYAIELFGEFAYLNNHHRPEIRQWLSENYLFEAATVF